jgi:hypothetical protein
MNGRAFLDSAQRLAQGSIEADRRSAAGRAYYALLLESRDALQRWGFVLPRRDQIHAFVRMRFSYPAPPDLKAIGKALEDLGVLRNKADYELTVAGPFANASRAQNAVQQAWTAIAVLDAIDGDPARRAAAIAAIRTAFAP